MPLKIRSDNDLQEYPSADFDAMIQNLMVYTALASTDGYTIRYELGTSTADYSKGTGIADTRLNVSGNYQTNQVSDDYRLSRISKRYTNNYKYILFKIN